jgi:hypothetical protein
MSKEEVSQAILDEVGKLLKQKKGSEKKWPLYGMDVPMRMDLMSG